MGKQSLKIQTTQTNSGNTNCGNKLLKYKPLKTTLEIQTAKKRRLKYKLLKPTLEIQTPEIQTTDNCDNYKEESGEFFFHVFAIASFFASLSQKKKKNNRCALKKPKLFSQGVTYR